MSPVGEADLKRLRTFVFALAHTWCPGAEDEAEDLTQDVMLRVLSRLDQFRGDAKLTSWIYVVARNVFVSRLRRASRRTRSEQLYATTAGTWRAEACLEVGYQKSSTAAIEQLSTWAVDGIISDEERNTIDLVVLQELTATEASERLGIAAGSVRARVCRAARRIRAHTKGVSPDH